jgi:hypothetical protein
MLFSSNDRELLLDAERFLAKDARAPGVSR